VSATALTASGDSFNISPGVDLPVSFFITDSAFIEPYVTMGALINTTVSQAFFVFGGGYRLGIHF
jgi:hypothetical protein